MAMEITEKIIQADAIEREAAEGLISALGECVSELRALAARIDAGEFDV